MDIQKDKKTKENIKGKRKRGLIVGVCIYLVDTGLTLGMKGIKSLKTNSETTTAASETTTQKTAFYLLILPGSKKFKTAALSKQIGSARLSFAEPEFMEQYLNITPGSVSVLGLMNDPENKVRLLIDKDILENHPYFGCHPCINTSSLKFRTEDLLNKILPAIHHNYTIVDLPYAE